MIPVTVVGGGRMARAIATVVEDGSEFQIRGVLVRREPQPVLPGAPVLERDLKTLLAADPRTVVLDFSSPEDLKQRVETIARAGHALVEGTTGLDEAATRALAAAAERIPVVVAPNTSPGIALLRRGLRSMLASRGSAWNVSVLDRHHRRKKDAPSGTADLLRSEIEDVSGASPEIASFRQGGVPGEHTVFIAGEEEEIALSHRAFSRNLFARGALLAAAFAWDADPGLYSMDDVLG